MSGDFRRGGPWSAPANERPRTADIPARDPLGEMIQDRANEAKVAKRRLWLTIGLVLPLAGLATWFSSRRSRRGGFGRSSGSSGG